MYEYVTVDMYATLFTFVGRNCMSSFGAAARAQNGGLSLIHI